MTVTTSPVPSEVIEARERYDRAHEAFAAGQLTRDEVAAALDECMTAVSRLSITHRPALDCPQWCNNHQFFWGEAEGEGYSRHEHRVALDGYTIDVTEGEEEFRQAPLVVYLPQFDWLNPAEARTYAHTILAALDEVEGVGASGRAARRLHERLSGQNIDVDAFEAACEALGVDVFEMFTGTSRDEREA